jgi:hypothetical protein
MIIRDLFIRIVTRSHYNICNSPVQLPQRVIVLFAKQKKHVIVQSQGHYSHLSSTIICEPNKYRRDMCSLLHRATHVQCSLASVVEPWPQETFA